MADTGQNRPSLEKGLRCPAGRPFFQPPLPVPGLLDLASLVEQSGSLGHGGEDFHSFFLCCIQTSPEKQTPGAPLTENKFPAGP